VISLANNETLESIESELSYTHISEEYDIKELESVINGILEEFPGRMGEIFMMLHRDGYTIKETAEVLKINERTVKYKSRQAIDTLKRIMEKEGMDAKSFKVARDVSSSVIYIVFMADMIIS
jgi:DNA-directed RNA polymerase specialized sigma24 family protein